MTSPDGSRVAERWFLDRGLPSVLTNRERWRAVWPRSAPALSALAVLAVCKLVIYWLTGEQQVRIDSIDITAVERVTLVILAFALPLCAAVGWLVARIASDTVQSACSAVAVVISLACDVIELDPMSAIETCTIIVVFLVLTAVGIGSVLGWASRLALAQLKGVRQLMIGALPVVLLIVLVFFNTYVWLMSSNISETRLALALMLLLVIATTFVISRTLEEAKPTLLQATAEGQLAERLAGTPFAHLPDPPEADPLSRGERFNKVFVLAATQITQILTVSIVTSVNFFLLGVILLNDDVLDEWTNGGPNEASLPFIMIPVPQALVNITAFLAALTFMYLSARAVTDKEYRSKFVEPLIEDLHLTLLARNRYRYAQRHVAPDTGIGVKNTVIQNDSLSPTGDHQKRWEDGFVAACRERGWGYVSGEGFVVDDTYITMLAVAVWRPVDGRISVTWSAAIKPLALDDILWAALLPNDPMGRRLRLHRRVIGALRITPLQIGHGGFTADVLDPPRPQWNALLAEFDAVRTRFLTTYPTVEQFVAAARGAADAERPVQRLREITALIAAGRPAEAAAMAEAASTAGERGPMWSNPDVYDYLSAHRSEPPTWHTLLDGAALAGTRI